MRTFYEFFAGGGMARMGLGRGWQCLRANDFCPKKARAYLANWGGAEFLQECIGKLTPSDFPGEADLAWASFPCQDLSLAGNMAGLAGQKSGAFWPFWKIVEGLIVERRAPRIIAIENVVGMLTSGNGKDFAAVCKTISQGGYRIGAIVLDAADFVPQSRKRVFLLAFRGDLLLPKNLIAQIPSDCWHPPAMRRAVQDFCPKALESWLWLTPKLPRMHRAELCSIIEDVPTDVCWNTDSQTAALLEMMSPVNRKKVEQAAALKSRFVGTLYKRTRAGKQRAEVRFDIAGCLRTPGGGSSRQTVIIIENGEVRTRLLSTREAARLMGLPDTYQLPKHYNEAYHLVGDGLVIPAVAFVAKEILRPTLVLSAKQFTGTVAA